MLQKEVMVILNRKNIAPLVHSKKKKKKLIQDRMNSFYLLRHLKRLCYPILDVSIIYMVQLFRFSFSCLSVTDIEVIFQLFLGALLS